MIANWYTRLTKGNESIYVLPKPLEFWRDDKITIDTSKLLVLEKVEKNWDLVIGTHLIDSYGDSKCEMSVLSVR